MHSSFKTKQNFNRQHSLNPYSRSIPSRSSSFQRFVNHRAQELDDQNALGLNRAPPSANSCNKTTHSKIDTTLPLKMVFSRTINMPSNQMYHNADANKYFSRKCSEITEQRSQPSSCTEIPKKRLPLMNLSLQNTLEPSFRGDSFQTFRSVSSRYNSIKSNKENCVQELDCFEDLQLTPPKKETSSWVQQQKTKHMFDFGTGTEGDVHSDRQQQNVSHKLMTSADFLVTSSNRRGSSRDSSSVSSPRLSIPDNDDNNDSFMEDSRPNLSPISSVTSAADGSQYSGVVKALELFSFNTSAPSPPVLATTLATCNSLDRLLSTSLPLSEGSIGSCSLSAHDNCNANRCGFDNRLQKCHQNSSVYCIGGSGQDIVNKRCDQRGSGRNSDGIGQDFVDRKCNQGGYGLISVDRTQNYDGKGRYYVDRRCDQEGSGRNSVSSSRNYDGIGRNNVERSYNQEGSGRNLLSSSRNYDGIGRNNGDRSFNHEGSGRNSVGSSLNYDAIGRNNVEGSYNQEGSGQNSVSSSLNYDAIGRYNVEGSYNQEGSRGNSVSTSHNYDGIGRNNVERSYNQEGSGRNSVSSSRNYDGIGQNNFEGRYNQEGSGRNSVSNSRNYDVIGRNNGDRSFNQEGSGQNSVSTSQNYDGIGMNHIKQRCNQGGSGRNSVNSPQNYDLQRNYLERRCDRDAMDCDESIGLLSDNFYVRDNTETDKDSEGYSISSEVVIPQHLLDIWRLSPSPLSTSNLVCQQIFISDDDNDNVVVNNDGSATDNTADNSAQGHLGRNEAERSVNHASWTSKKVFTRLPLISDPDEE